jgi:hypothetical protein
VLIAVVVATPVDIPVVPIAVVVAPVETPLEPVEIPEETPVEPVVSPVVFCAKQPALCVTTRRSIATTASDAMLACFCLFVLVFFLCACFSPDVEKLGRNLC